MSRAQDDIHGCISVARGHESKATAQERRLQGLPLIYMELAKFFIKITVNNNNNNIMSDFLCL